MRLSAHYRCEKPRWLLRPLYEPLAGRPAEGPVRERAASRALIPGAVLARPRRPHLPPPLSHTHSVGRSTGRALPPAAAAGA